MSSNDELVFCCIPRYLYLLYESFLKFHDEVSRATSTDHISVTNADFLSRHFLVFKEFALLDDDYLQRVIFVRTVLEHLQRTEGPFDAGSVLSDLLINLANFHSVLESPAPSNVWRDGYHIFALHAPLEFQNWTVDITRGGKITVAHHTSTSVVEYDQVPFPVPSEVSSGDPKIILHFPIEGPASFRSMGVTFALERFLVALHRFNDSTSLS